jgi:arylsulfatase A-like enzyme
MSFIEAKEESPWFAHISFFSPHPPFVAPAPYHDMYDPARVSLPLRRDTAEEEAAQHPLTAQSVFNQRDYLATDGRPVFDLEPELCGMNMIRDVKYKYVHFTALPPVLFNLENDPNEFVNLAEHRDYRQVVAEYAQKLLSWRIQFDDRGLTHIRH